MLLVGRRLGAIVAAAVASCATYGAPRSTTPPLGGPLFPPVPADARPHEPTGVSPLRSSSDAVADRRWPVPAHHDLLATCARDITAGRALCQALTGGEDSDCVNVCLDAFAEAHPRPRGPPFNILRPPAGTAAAPPQTSPIAPEPPSAPSSPLASAPDPFAFVLRDCILRVRDSGGSEPAVCHFDPPLDAMGFGQRHCDAKCAALTEAFRSSGSRPPGAQ